MILMMVHFRYLNFFYTYKTLFSGTIADNIGYRDLTTGIDMKRVELAAKTANADEFIRNLPEGYSTGVGPRGSSLSGGQKQRWGLEE